MDPHHMEAYSGDEEVDEFIEEANVVEDAPRDQEEGLVEDDDAYADEELEELDGEGADDEEEQGPGGGGGGGGAPQGQMVYIPGLGHIPLANLGNLGGLLAGGMGGGMGGRGGPPAPNPEGLRPWDSLRALPQATQHGLEDVVHTLREDGRAELTVLLLGRGGAGKSSTVNSLLGERAANVAAFQQDAARPICFSREVDGFRLHLIDTPSLLDQDAVSEERLEQIAAVCEGRAIDAVLFLERLDQYSVGPLERRMFEGVSRVLGAGMWRNALLGFSRASESAAPPGQDFHDFVAQRAQQLRGAILAAGAPADAELRVTLVENSSRCPTNNEGEKVVPGELPWIVDLAEKLAEVALNISPFHYDAAAAAKASNPNRRRKWLIPLVLFAQVALKLLLDRVIEDDGCKGDDNGPFDEQTVKERRAELQADKETARRKQERTRKAAAVDEAPWEEEDLEELEDF